MTKGALEERVFWNLHKAKREMGREGGKERGREVGREGGREGREGRRKEGGKDKKSPVGKLIIPSGVRGSSYESGPGS